MYENPYHAPLQDEALVTWATLLSDSDVKIVTTKVTIYIFTLLPSILSIKHMSLPH